MHRFVSCLNLSQMNLCYGMCMRLFSVVNSSRQNACWSLCLLMMDMQRYIAFIAQRPQGDTDRARDLYQVAKNSINPPRDYLNVLDGFYFAQIDDVAQVVDFDWVDGEALATGWLKETPATGITIGIQSSELVFKGTQQRSATPVNRAWRLWPKRGIRQGECETQCGCGSLWRY